MAWGVEVFSYRLIRLLFTFSIIGPIIFIIIFIVEGWRRPEYSPVYHMVSSLSRGNHGWIQIISFLICSLSILGLTVGFKFVIQDGVGSLWGPILLTIFGVGLCGAGLFVADPVLGYPPGLEGDGTLVGNLHNFFSLAVFISLPAFIFIMVKRFSEYPDWRGWVAYSVLTGIFFIIFFIGFFTASILVETGKLSMAPVGLLQRITIIIGWSWISVFAFLLSVRL